MLPAAKTDLFNPLAPKTHNSECQNILYIRINIQYTIFFTN